MKNQSRLPNSWLVWQPFSFSLNADVATRPWRTPRLACRLSRTVMHPGVWKISCPASRRFCRPSTEQVNYSKMPLQIARAGSAVHELQMTPAARLRRAARAICNRFGGCSTVVRAISRQCAATRRIADGAIPSVSCGQPFRACLAGSPATRCISQLEELPGYVPAGDFVEREDDSHAHYRIADQLRPLNLRHVPVFPLLLHRQQASAVEHLP